MDVFGVFILLGVMLLSVGYLVGLVRLLRAWPQLDAKRALRMIDRFSLLPGIGLSILVGLSCAEAVLTSAQPPSGWDAVGQLSLIAVLAGLGGAWTWLCVRWLLRRQYRRRSQGDSPA
jgi:hypothetical protein